MNWICKWEHQNGVFFIEGIRCDKFLDDWMNAIKSGL